MKAAAQRAALIGVIATIGTLMLTPRTGSAQPADYPPPQDFYRENEFSIDLFGSGSIGQSTIENFSGDRVTEDVRLGAGIGLNYFVTRHFGFSGEAYTENTANNFVDVASLNLIGRLPIGSSGLAPYLLGGGGYQFDEVEQWLLNAGGGVEFRFHPNWGLFVDARYVVAEETKNYGLGRAGLRLSF